MPSFDEIGGLLEARGLLLRAGTIVDATIIAAPGSIGADKHGIVHSVRATAAAVADVTQMLERTGKKSTVSSLRAGGYATG